MTRRSTRQRAPVAAAPGGGSFALGAILIVAAAVAVYGRTLGFAFTNWDDDFYIINNPLVRAFSWGKLGAVFTSVDLGNYHPLTMLSYIVEHQLFGLDPHVHHLTNLFLHAASGLLFFWLGWLLLRRLPAALIAALLFVVHPLQVESVAWIAERKNVLAAFFGLAALVAYTRRREDAGPVRALAPTFVLFALALLSKATAAFLPPVLLLVDYFRGRPLDRACWREKAPFFGLAVVAGVVAIWAQRGAEAIQTTRAGWWLDGFFVACRGLLFYVIQAIVPFDLSPIHPYPRNGGFKLPLDYLAAPVAVALLAVALTFWLRRAGEPTRRIVVFCIGFYVVNLLPVIQLLPVGRSVVADRYFYVPGAGLFLLAGVGFDALTRRWAAMPRARGVLLALGVAAVVVLGWQARAQTEVWRNGMNLWNYVLARYPDSKEALTNRSELFAAHGDAARAFDDLNQAVISNPDDATAFYNRGCALLDRGQMDAALADLDRAIQLNPTLVGAYNNRGDIHLHRKQFPEALADFNAVIRLAPDDGLGYNNRARVYYHMKDYSAAWADAQRALALGFQVDPRFIDALKSGRGPS